MRYEDWDVMLFSSSPSVPVHEFRTACSYPNNNTNLAPTVTCYIPSLPPGTPFRICLHNWQRPVQLSPTILQHYAPNRDLKILVQIFIGGAQVYHGLLGPGTRWPKSISRSIHRYQRSRPLILLPCPPAHESRTSLDLFDVPQYSHPNRRRQLTFPLFTSNNNATRSDLFPGDQQQNRISVVLQELVVDTVPRNGAVGYFAKNELVCFSFVHAPRSMSAQMAHQVDLDAPSQHGHVANANEVVLEQAAIAWPVRIAQLMESAKHTAPYLWAPAGADSAAARHRDAEWEGRMERLHERASGMRMPVGGVSLGEILMNGTEVGAGQGSSLQLGGEVSRDGERENGITVVDDDGEVEVQEMDIDGEAMGLPNNANARMTALAQGNQGHQSIREEISQIVPEDPSQRTEPQEPRDGRKRKATEAHEDDYSMRTKFRIRVDSAQERENQLRETERAVQSVYQLGMDTLQKSTPHTWQVDDTPEQSAAKDYSRSHQMRVEIKEKEKPANVGYAQHQKSIAIRQRQSELHDATKRFGVQQTELESLQARRREAQYPQVSKLQSQHPFQRSEQVQHTKPQHQRMCRFQPSDLVPPVGLFRTSIPSVSNIQGGRPDIQPLPVPDFITPLADRHSSPFHGTDGLEAPRPWDRCKKAQTFSAMLELPEFENLPRHRARWERRFDVVVDDELPVWKDGRLEITQAKEPVPATHQQIRFTRQERDKNHGDGEILDSNSVKPSCKSRATGATNHQLPPGCVKSTKYPPATLYTPLTNGFPSSGPAAFSTTNRPRAPLIQIQANSAPPRRHRPSSSLDHLINAAEQILSDNSDCQIIDDPSIAQATQRVQGEQQTSSNGTGVRDADTFKRSMEDIKRHLEGIAPAARIPMERDTGSTHKPTSSVDSIVSVERRLFSAFDEAGHVPHDMKAGETQPLAPHTASPPTQQVQSGQSVQSKKSPIVQLEMEYVQISSRTE